MSSIQRPAQPAVAPPTPKTESIQTVVDLAPPPPRVASGEASDRLSERILGSERRFRHGADGEVRLPELSRDQLQLDQLATQRLANSRVYLLPGTPWPGVAEKGTAWLEPWARTLEAAGVGRAVPIRYTESGALASNLKMLVEPVTHQQRDEALKRIDADLAAHPLKPGERIFLVGHSYGARLGGEVASELVERGLPVKGYVAIEDRPPNMPRLLDQAPAVPEFLEVENKPGKPVKTPAGTAYRRLLMPNQGHMDFVLAPPQSLLTALIESFAR